MKIFANIWWHNYEIRERNVRFKHDEIDIIAYDQVEKMIVFVEVKNARVHPLRIPQKRL